MNSRLTYLLIYLINRLFRQKKLYLTDSNTASNTNAVQKEFVAKWESAKKNCTRTTRSRLEQVGSQSSREIASWLAVMRMTNEVRGPRNCAPCQTVYRRQWRRWRQISWRIDLSVAFVAACSDVMRCAACCVVWYNDTIVTIGIYLTRANAKRLRVPSRL